MKNKKYISYCNPIFKNILLLVFLFSISARSEFDGQRNKSFEERLHSIYENNYSRPVVDSDWFKLVDGVDEQVHTVKPKDTLWSISKIYFGDGFFWSKLWSVNSRITNPHLIFVGDQIHFKVGNPKNPPQVNVQKGEGLTSIDENEEGDEGEDEDDSSGTIQISESRQASTPIPKMFSNSVDLREVKKVKLGLTVEDRPPLRLNTELVITKDILADRPQHSGTVVSLGHRREITGDKGQVLILAVGGINVGETYSIVNNDVESVDVGYVVKLKGTVKITGQTSDGVYYVGQVMSQYDAITVNSMVSTYQVQKVSLNAEGRVASTPFEVLKSDLRTIWGREEIVLLKSTGGNFNVGELLKVKNYLDPSFQSFYNSGLLKVATVSGAYAAAVVLYNNAEISAEETVSGL